MPVRQNDVTYLVSQFLNSKASATRTAYGREIDAFVRWRGDKKPEITFVKLLNGGHKGAMGALSDYQSHLVDKGKASATINRSTAVIVGVFRLAFERALVPCVSAGVKMR